MVVDEEALAETARIPKQILTGLVSESEHALSDRKNWEYKLRDAYTSRYGIRAQKTFPWKGASNLNIPIVEKVIRRIAPTLQSAVFRVSPIVTIEPLGDMSIKTARDLEQGYDWLLRYRMDNARETMIFVEDAVLTYGMAFVKNVWEYDAETRTRTIKADLFGDVDPKVVPLQELRLQIIRQMALDPTRNAEQIEDAMRQFKNGDEEISVSSVEPIYDAPRWHYVDPIDIIVPWDAGTEVDRLPWIAHRMRKTKREVEVAVKNGRYNSEVGKTVLESFGRSPTSAFSEEIEMRKLYRERIFTGQRQKPSTTELWEIYFHHDLDGDGVSEKYVGTYSVSAREWLRVIPFEYEHGQWPFTRFAFEMTEPRWYSPRGVPEHLRDLQIEINANHNAWVDNLAIKSSAAFVYRAGSIRDPNWRFRPGAMFPTQRGPQDVAPITHQPFDFAHNNMEERLRAWGEELIGTPDFGISNINQRVERRTATEVEQISASTGAIADALLERFQEAMRRLHRQTLLLWAQYGDPQVLVRVTGTDNVANFVRFDITRDYDLVPTGRIDNLSPQARLQRAGAMQMVANDPVLGPFVRPYEVVREIFENLDYSNADRFLQEPGVFDMEAVGKQASEITTMLALGIVWPVDQREPHEIHIQTCIRALQEHQGNERVVQLISAHMALHLYFVGQKGALEQLQQQGAQVQAQGPKLSVTLPEAPVEEEATVA